jgi:hypothetical protein
MEYGVTWFLHLFCRQEKPAVENTAVDTRVHAIIHVS